MTRYRKLPQKSDACHQKSARRGPFRAKPPEGEGFSKGSRSIQ